MAEQHRTPPPVAQLNQTIQQQQQQKILKSIKELISQSANL